MPKIKSLINGDAKRLKKLQKLADNVDKYSSLMEKYTDEELAQNTEKFKARLKSGESLDDIKAEAFAVVREAAKRVRNEYPYKVQIMGADAIHNGDIAEMKTGEGKTLTATLAVYLNALEGKGVHVVTVNEYLSKRDAKTMGEIYNFLGLSVGWNSQELNQKEKQKAYACDITYTTNSELGFDYLRDNMVFNPKEKVQRGLHFALIDEADSILIDEARTPLLISQPGDEDTSKYNKVDYEVKKLLESDYEIFKKENQVSLLPSGIEKLQKAFGVKNLYEPKNQDLLHKINKSLYANTCMQKDVDYLVKDDAIYLIDKFTGRVMVGHAYSEGLQQAIQAKENVTIEPENKTAATITYQNFFRLYDKLAGMTGTAKTEEEEFLSIYNMYVTPIPTNKPVIREDKVDAIFRTKEIKFKNVVKEVKSAYEKGRPVLIGTIDVDTNELLSNLLKKEGIPHELLNAKNHEREAEIIAKAGTPKAVTLATNMAGRGTDIKLTNKSRELGGLYVIGTERHDSRRIDNQLRGRSGRQGDPGTSVFFISLEDTLMQRYGGSTIEKMFEKYVGEDRLESKSISKSITNAQKSVEGFNFDSRKQLIEFDDVLRQQREVFFEKREEIVHANQEKVHKKTMEYIQQSLNTLAVQFKDDNESLHNIFHDRFRITDLTDRKYNNSKEIVKIDELNELKLPPEKASLLSERLWKYYSELIGLNDVVKEACIEKEKEITLSVMDSLWVNHIDYMDKLKSSTGLRSYAQKKPIDEYKDAGYNAFVELLNDIATTTAEAVCRLRPSLIENGKN